MKRVVGTQPPLGVGWGDDDWPIEAVPPAQVWVIEEQVEA